MKMKAGFFSLLAVLFLTLSINVNAAQSPTPQQALEAVLSGVMIMEELGSEGLVAFNDPKSELQLGGALRVFVTDCEQGKMIAHPIKQYIGLSAEAVKDVKTGRLILKEACEQLSPKGIWVEFWWPEKPGSENIIRRAAFIVPVPNSNYQIGVSIPNDNTIMEELNNLLK